MSKLKVCPTIACKKLVGNHPFGEDKIRLTSLGGTPSFLCDCWTVYRAVSSAGSTIDLQGCSRSPSTNNTNLKENFKDKRARAEAVCTS